ncbi:carbon-nitrogen hydrolase [Aspergillus japonicus CBS 114.51]|uniref:Carbon-nitrogen hydrolase n=1 Tax=Aspergillus japonicus CBS 114.51 TaxID=1448312 RepID=A0A8T8X5W0_ASPJA|nr:carbon-nitrogen hydrolase [Aspergillus japonicus CBS 114.51]RAH83304.1 carbon-nitrogen hydrolase [Aspergillus japonicus CBS 114.51]
MRIATLQFAPQLGDVKGNIKRADELLKNGKVVRGVGTGAVALGVLKPDILILPELALTGECDFVLPLTVTLCMGCGMVGLGYNFPSLEAIKPYLEPAGEGPSADWARQTAQRLQCKVCVGYPEVYMKTATREGDESSSQHETYYNSLLVVDENGRDILNYRKSFLYYTDETWASEGSVDRGFEDLIFRKGDQHSHESHIATSFGICMDINPYKFEAPFTAWEFANRVMDSKSQLVILSMAWLSSLGREELDLLADEPDLDTFNYWIQRFLPLVTKRMSHEVNLNEDGSDRSKDIVIVFANRAGEEPGAAGANPARYAGTSTIIAISQRPKTLPASEAARSDNLSRSKAQTDSGDDGESQFDVKILCWDMMGATTEGICFADTAADPSMVFALAKRSSS